jgi:hypothetical protein
MFTLRTDVYFKDRPSWVMLRDLIRGISGAGAVHEFSDERVLLAILQCSPGRT